jgi:hypothetical protein
MLSEALTEVQALVHARANYERFAALVRGNKHVLHGESEFPVHVQRWFSHFAAMSIRRIVEPNGSGGIVSLRSVLDEMIRAARAFTSESIAELFDAPDSPRYDAELKAFLITSMWENVSYSGGAQEQLDAKMLKHDRRMLELVSGEIKEMVDKTIAHHVSHTEEYTLLYPELSTCIDVIEAIALRYQATLLGPSMSTLVPTDLSNWFDIFARNWLYEEPKTNES